MLSSKTWLDRLETTQCKMDTKAEHSKGFIYLYFNNLHFVATSITEVVNLLSRWQSQNTVAIDECFNKYLIRKHCHETLLLFIHEILDY